MPVTTPIWMIVLGCFIANIIFKMLFGGFGHNIFNPALIAYAFLMLSFAGTINTEYFEFTELTNIATSTPLDVMHSEIANGAILTKELLVEQYGSLMSLFIGTIPGALGETSVLLCLVAFVYLVVRKVIDWYVPTIYIGTVFILTMLIGFINGYGLWFPLYNILSGGLFFGAVFMATEPVTTPRNPLGKVIYALGIGVLTTLFRFVGAYPEGVATSILFMCLFTSLIDRFTSIFRANKVKPKNGLILASILLVFCGISAYCLYKTNYPKEKNVPPVTETTEENSFVIQVKGHNGPITVEFFYEDNVITKMVPILNTESILYSPPVKEAFEVLPDALVEAGANFEQVEEIASATVSSKALKESYRLAFEKLNEMYTNGYITSDDGEKIALTIKGEKDVIKLLFNYNNLTITNMEVEVQDEQIAYANVSTEVFVSFTNRLVQAKDDYLNVANVSSASKTCDILKQAYRVAFEYLNTKYINGYIEQDTKTSLTISIKGQNDLITATFAYDDDKKISSMTIDYHNELVISNEEVKKMFEEYPNLLVSAGKGYNNVENISGLEQTSLSLKKAYGMAYNYLNGNAVIEYETSDYIIANVKGHNSYIRIKFSYLKHSILQVLPIGHNESVKYSEEVKQVFETFPDLLINKDYTFESIENVAGATVSSVALKNAYLSIYNYLLSRELKNQPEGILIKHNTFAKTFSVGVAGYRNPIVVEFVYDENNNIVSMTPILHSESVSRIEAVEVAFETIPSLLVNAGSDYESVEVISGATYSCLALKQAYAYAYQFLQGGE